VSATALQEQEIDEALFMQLVKASQSRTLRCYLHKQGRVWLRAASAEMTMRLELKILRGVTKMNSRITTLDF